MNGRVVPRAASTTRAENLRLPVELTPFLEDFARSFPVVVEVWLFGSRANRTATDASDWDLLVLSRDRLTAVEVAQAERFRKEKFELFIANGDAFECPWPRARDGATLSGTFSSWKWLSRSKTPSGLSQRDFPLHPSGRSATLPPKPHVSCRRARMILVIGLSSFLRALLFGSAVVALENMALRHQLAVLQRSVRRPRLSRWDRILWVWLSRVWTDWRSSLVIIRPATVVAWHRQGFQLYWRWKSGAPSVGRPRLDPELRHLIRRMARENPTWGRRRIRAELALLGHNVAELTVAKYMRRTSPRPSPTWRAFLAAHLREMVAVDFFVVPTLPFRLLFVFVVLRHERRELLHFNVTEHPTGAWTARQIVEAFPDDTAPNYLLRDRDGVYGDEFVQRVQGMGIRQVLTPHERPGRTHSWSDSSAQSVASAWIISSF